MKDKRKATEELSPSRRVKLGKTKNVCIVHPDDEVVKAELQNSQRESDIIISNIGYRWTKVSTEEWVKEIACEANEDKQKESKKWLEEFGSYISNISQLTKESANLHSREKALKKCIENEPNEGKKEELQNERRELQKKWLNEQKQIKEQKRKAIGIWKNRHQKHPRINSISSSEIGR